MSTIYGINKNSLFTVNPTTGEWTLVAALSGLPLNFVAAGLVYNTSNGTMYLTAADSTNEGATSSRLYTLNLVNGILTFVNSITGTLGTYKSPIRGLAYDKLLDQCYALNASEWYDGLNTTYTLNLSNGGLTRIGSPPLSYDPHFALVYEDTTSNLYGLSGIFAQTIGVNLNNVDKTTGVWTIIGPIVENGNARAMTYDPTTGIFYGSSFTTGPGSYNKTFTINVSTGEWTELGDTVNAAQPQAMAVVPNPICVHADTQVKLAQGQVKTISTVVPGDLLVQYNGQPTPVRRNIMSGHKTQFVRVPKNAFCMNSPSEDLLIRHGHPLLLEGKSVPCEALIGQLGICEVELERPTAIYTLLTDTETFVFMNGVLVGTWAEKAYKARFE